MRSAHSRGSTAQDASRDPVRSLLVDGLTFILMLMATRRVALAQETITTLSKISVSTTTGEKPQSKIWFHAGRWWTVLPSTSVSPTGTWLWRLGADNRWTNVLRLASSTSSKADAKVVGDVTHVLLHSGAPQLVSLEYVPASTNYAFWSVRPNATSISLSGSETATIDIDTTDRMWLSTESGSNVRVYYSDYPYSAFSGPITLANNINSDDITVVTALPVPDPPKIGVLWSNQNTQRFGFRVHFDDDRASVWDADEVPASQSALHVGAGMADDHLNVAVASDGTLYAAVKTSYDSSGFPVIALLVRRPDGTWDALYHVDTIGTRGIVLLNEPADLIRVVYTSSSSGGNILYRDSLMSAIGFGARKTLMTGTLNNATSTKENWTNQVVVIASGRGVLITHNLDTKTTTTTTTTTSTTTTLAAGAAAVLNADVSVVVGDSTAYGKNSKLEVDNSPVKHAFLRFTVSGTGGHAVTSAILRLQVANVSGAESDSKGRVHTSTCGWDEATLTGTTQPQPTIGSGVLDAPSGSVTQGQVVDFTVTGAITGDGVFCLALDTLSSNGVDYTSREVGAGGPQMLITVAR